MSMNSKTSGTESKTCNKKVSLCYRTWHYLVLDVLSGFAVPVQTSCELIVSLMRTKWLNSIALGNKRKVSQPSTTIIITKVYCCWESKECLSTNLLHIAKSFEVTRQGGVKWWQNLNYVIFVTTETVLYQSVS